MTESRGGKQVIPVQRAVSEVDVEEFVFEWKLKIFSPSGQVLTTQCESPIFYGRNKCQFSWQMKWSNHSHLDGYYGTLCVVDLVKLNATNLEIKKPYHDNRRTVAGVKVAALITVKDSDAFDGMYENMRIESLDPADGYIVDNSITFKCKVFLQYGEHHKLICTDKEKQAEGIQGLSEDMKNLLGTKKFGDVILRTPTKDFPAHKAILSARSPVFAAMFQSDMLEAKENVVNIVDADDEVLAGMLEYIYTGKTTKLDPKNRDSEKSAELLKLADMYQLQGLKEQSEITLGSFLKTENAGEILLLASMHNAVMLKSAVMEFIKGNKKQIVASKQFQAIMKTNPDLLIDLYAMD